MNVTEEGFYSNDLLHQLLDRQKDISNSRQKDISNGKSLSGLPDVVDKRAIIRDLFYASIYRRVIDENARLAFQKLKSLEKSDDDFGRSRTSSDDLIAQVRKEFDEKTEQELLKKMRSVVKNRRHFVKQIIKSIKS